MADPYVPFGYMPPTLAGNPALPFPTPEGLLPDVSPQTPGALQRLHGLGLGFFAPFSPVPPPMRTTRMVPTLGGERELPVTQVTNFGSGDPEAEAAGRMLGTGPAMRGVGMALESAPAQWLASQLARPAVGAPAATAGTVAATTAETQQPAGMTAAQRQARIEALNKDIARREKILEGFATRNFQSTVARQEASKPHQDAITAARDEIKSIRSGQEAEAARAAQEVKDRERALSGWTQTYPWLVPASGAAGFGLGSWLSNALARAGVRRFNTRTAELDQRWGEAVGRAGNRQAAPATREAATVQAESYQDQFRRITEGPGGWRGIFNHGGPRSPGSALAPFFGTEIGVGIPTVMDEWAAYSTPMGSPARQHSQEFWSHPENIAGRFVPGLILGNATGHFMTGMARRGASAPLGYHAETAALRRPQTLVPGTATPTATGTQTLPPPAATSLGPPPSTPLLPAPQPATPNPAVSTLQNQRPSTAPVESTPPPAPRGVRQAEGPPEGAVWNPRTNRWHVGNRIVGGPDRWPPPK